MRASMRSWRYCWDASWKSCCERLGAFLQSSRRQHSLLDRQVLDLSSEALAEAFPALRRHLDASKLCAVVLLCAPRAELFPFDE